MTNTLRAVAALLLLLTSALAANHGVRRAAGPRPSLVTSALPHEWMDMKALPAEYDIRAMGGRSLATDNRNQHIPQCALTPSRPPPPPPPPPPTHTPQPTTAPITPHHFQS